MSTFESFKNTVLDTFTSVSVVEKGSTIAIDGIRAQALVGMIDGMWRTGRIAGNMFSRATSRRLEFPSFFAVEVLYVIEKILAEKRNRLPRKQLVEIITQLKANTWLKSLNEPVPGARLNRNALEKFNLPPLDHQNTFFAEYEAAVCKYRLNGYLLAAAPGSGKTLAYLYLSEMLEPDVTIVLCPMNAVDRVFRATLNERFVDTPTAWYSDSGELPTPGKRYYICHYESLGKLNEFLRANGYNKKRVNICLDECHNFNDLKSMRTEMFVELCKWLNPISVLWGSGTPIKAMGSEVIPLLRTIDRFFVPPVETRFRAIFGLSSTRGLDILANRIGKVSFKIDKQATVGNQVDKYRIDLSIPNGDRYTLKNIRTLMGNFIKERETYYRTNEKKYLEQYQQGLAVYSDTLRTPQAFKELDQYRRWAAEIRRGYDPVVHKDIALWCNRYEKQNIIPTLPQPLKNEFKSARSVYKYVNLKIVGEALGRILGKEREQCNIDMLQAINDYAITELFADGDKYDSSMLEIIATSDSKTLIFTSYVGVVTALDAVLKKEKLQPLLVYGETNKNLSSIMQAFFTNPKIDPLIATFPSLSTAVPVIAASTVIFLNAPFRAHEYEQALSRVDRIGQQHVVRAYDVYLSTGNEPNISTRSIDIMEWSKNMVETIMGVKAVDTAALESMDGQCSYQYVAALEELGVVEGTGLEDILEDTTGEYDALPADQETPALEQASPNTGAWSNW